MRIGEVHAQLRKYFPDIELSKIRYYEDKGLVQPSRSRKGYRLYSERDVECLREHYQKTCTFWLRRLEANAAKAVALTKGAN